VTSIPCVFPGSLRGHFRQLGLGAALLATSVLAFGSDTTPAPAATLSLQDALSATLAQSPALQVQKSVIEQKFGLLGQAGGAFDWTANGSVDYTKDRTPILGLPGTEPVNSSDNTAYSAGVSHLFRNGIYLAPSASVGVQESISPAGPTYGVSQLSVQILVPLLRGLGRDSTGAAEAAARGDVEVAKLLYQHALAAEAFGTAVNYWTSRSADETLAVQRDVERSAEKLVESTKVLVRSGVFPPAFLLQAEANLRDKRTTRIQAELNAHEARFSLGQSLGLPPEAIAKTPAPANAFPVLGAPIAPFDDNTQSTLIVRALHHRADYRASQQSQVPLNILARQAELDLKPEVNLSGSVGYKGIDTGSSPISPLGKRLTGANTEVGVSIAWPFRNSYQRGLLRERRGNQAQVAAQTVQLAQSVANDVLVALEQLRLRADTVRSAQETVQIAKQALDAQYDQVKAGDGTILDLISLENLSSSARISYISAHASYAIAIAQLRYALGEVFTDNGKDLTLADLTLTPDL
jgi:outer membrane protein TolC